MSPDFSAHSRRYARFRWNSRRGGATCCWARMGRANQHFCAFWQGCCTPVTARLIVFDSEGASDTPQRQRGRIGYMSHAAMLYDELTATENLAYFASLYRGQKCLDPADVLRSVGLDPALERPVGNYSQGMRQRTSLARVLISQPELLLLDEPFSNMDVGSARADDFAAGKIPRRTPYHPADHPPAAGCRTTGRLLPDTA